MADSQPPRRINTWRAPQSLDAIENLARIGVAVSAQNVELYSIPPENGDANLVANWSSFDHPLPPISAEDKSVPLAWFPWSLGNVRPDEYLFVRNAATLPVASAGAGTIGDRGMSSVLHVPLTVNQSVRGGLCVYWADEREAWDANALHQLCEWSTRALSQVG